MTSHFTTLLDATNKVNCVKYIKGIVHVKAIYSEASWTLIFVSRCECIREYRRNKPIR